MVRARATAIACIGLAMIAPLVVFVWLLAAGAAQKLIPVAVGREGDGLKLQFSPEEVFADVGDLIQFQFYPVNHSAVQAEFAAPCVPMTGSNLTRRGFFSGFRPLPLNTEMLTTFTVNVTRPDPIFFYCSQGRHCQQGFVGVINPTTSQSLAAFKEAASRAPETLSPGESPIIVPRPVPSKLAAAATDASYTHADSNRAATNVGAIVGGVLGGVAVFVVLVAVLVLPAMRRRPPKKPESLLKGTIGKPQLQLRGGYASYL